MDRESSNMAEGGKALTPAPAGIGRVGRSGRTYRRPWGRMLEVVPMGDDDDASCGL